MDHWLSIGSFKVSRLRLAYPVLLYFTFTHQHWIWVSMFEVHCQQRKIDCYAHVPSWPLTFAVWPSGRKGNPWTQRRWRRCRRFRRRCESVSDLSPFWSCSSFLISFYLSSIPSWQRALTGCESHVSIYGHIYIFLFYCSLITLLIIYNNSFFF